MAPEGTRKYRPYWRSGFYHIAMAAKVPLAIAYIDYATRTVGVVDYLDLSGDIELDWSGYVPPTRDVRDAPKMAAPIKCHRQSNSYFVGLPAK